MKTLVTGATGFIGSHLVERLVQEGHQVTCLAKDRLHYDFLESLQVEIVLRDLNDGNGLEAVLDGVGYIFHLAGVTRAKSYREYYEGNYMATKNFVSICTRSCENLKRFVFVSSQAAVGPSEDGRPLTEEDMYHPVSHYGKSKMLAEKEILSYQDRIPITIIRPSSVYGPREYDWYQYMCLIKKGIQPLIGFGRKWMNLIHVEDIVQGLLLAAEHIQAEDEVFFMGNEVSHTTQEIGDIIAFVLNRKQIRIYFPHLAVYAFGAIAEGVGKLTNSQIFFNLQKAKESVQSSWIISVEKAKSRLGFSQRVSLFEGMRKTCNWYKENEWL